MKSIILSANLKYLIDQSKILFRNNKGLHIDSNAWEQFISVGPAINYSFLVNGTIKFHTNSSISGKKYEQLMKLSDYKNIEPALLILYLLKIDEQTISEFIKRCFSLSNCRLKCDCPAYSYWGSHYNLTKLKSQYGEPEIREPNIRNPQKNRVVCKHLWMILTNFENNIDKFVKDLLPYYKRYFGLNSPTSVERTLKQLGEKGIFRTYNDAKKSLNIFKDKELYDNYIKIVDNKINSIFNQTKQIEQKPIEQPKEVNNKEVEQNIKQMEIKPEEEKVEEMNTEKEKQQSKEEIKEENIDKQDGEQNND